MVQGCLIGPDFLQERYFPFVNDVTGQRVELDGVNAFAPVLVAAAGVFVASLDPETVSDDLAQGAFVSGQRSLAAFFGCDR
jgi:hypothetical protein